MSTSPRKRVYALCLAGYVLALVGGYCLLYALGYVDQLPTAEGVVKYDVGYYRSIGAAGYEYAGGKPASAGFFPLFAYLWKWTTLGPLGMSLLNGGVYLVSLWALCVLLRPEPVTLGLYFSLPFLFFLYTPLSEAWFFAFAVLAIFGIVRERFVLVFAGLLLSGLTRPTFLFLVPALVGMELMLRPKAELLTRAVWRRIGLWYLLPIVLAAAGVAAVQWVQLGEPLAYYITQSEGWGRKPGLPVLPFGLGNDIYLGRLRSVNLWLGTLAAAFGLTYLFRWLVHDRIGTRMRPIELASVIYLCMCLVSIVFFNPEWKWMNDGGYNATILMGINRYLQPNPFLFIFVVFLFERPRAHWFYVLPLLVGTHLLWFTIDFDYYEHIRKYLVVTYITCLVLPYWLYYFLRWRVLGWAIVPLALYWQCVMFNNYLAGVHVD